MQSKAQAYFALGALCSLACGVLPALEVMPRAVLIPRRGGGRQESSNYTNQALFACVEVLPDSRPHRPRTDVIWLKNGDFLDTRPRKYRNYGMKKRLLVRNIVDEDSGVYECAFSLNSTEKGRAELWIAPHIVDAPPLQHLLASDNGTVVCRVSGGVREVQWRREGAIIASTTNSSGAAGSHYAVLPDGSLHVSGVGHQDRGLYECRVSNPAGQQTREIRVKVAKTTLPSAETSMPTEGPQVSTTHPPTTHSSPAHTTTDLPSAEPTTPSNCVEVGDVSFHSTPPLSTLPPPNRPPAAMQTQGAESSPVGTTNMTNLEAPYLTVLPPRCIRTTVGYSIVLHCSAAGSPPPTITWRKEGDTRPLNTTQTKLTTDHRLQHYSQLPNGSLQINTVQLVDRGRFTCTADSITGVKSASVRVRVMGERDICGVTATGQGGAREKRVVRGEVVSGVQEHPWQVLIEYSGTRGMEQLCGGALVRPDWVVTAAHCLYSSPRWRMPGELRLRVGVFNRSLTEDSQQELEVRSYLVHPNYRHPSVSTASQEYDIALLKLQRPVKLSDTARLVCLPLRSEEPPVGTRCTVTGWGHLQFGGDWSPDVLHRAQVPLVSYSHCRSAQSYGNRITRNILCAGYQEGGQDTCQNDSGGPLVCQSQGKWTLYGVVNYGEGCGAPHKYGLYARVTKFSEWIHDVMQAHSW